MYDIEIVQEAHLLPIREITEKPSISLVKGEIRRAMALLKISCDIIARLD